MFLFSIKIFCDWILIFRSIQPFCLGGVISYFAQTEDETITLNDAYFYASGIVLSTTFILITQNPFQFYIANTAYKLRVGCSGLMYQKSLRLTKLSAEDGQNGKIINLLSNDLAKFEWMLPYFHESWKGPLQSIVFLVLIYVEIGISGVVGVIFLLAFIPFQGNFQFVRGIFLKNVNFTMNRFI